MRWIVAVLVCLVCAITPAAGDSNASGSSAKFQPPPELDGDWKGAGTYDLEKPGIRIVVSAGQRILLLDENPLEIYSRCRNDIQAVVHDARLGLMLIGRSDSERPVVNYWDPEADIAFFHLVDKYRETKGPSARLPIDDAIYYSPPMYKQDSYQMRWSISFVRRPIAWFVTSWLTFDRDGLVSVTLLSRDDASLDALDEVFTANNGPPIRVTTLREHQEPLPAPGDRSNYTAGFLAMITEPAISACHLMTPFGLNF